jgi:replicative DNA helicase
MIEKTEKVIIGTILSITEFQEDIINQMSVELFSYNLNKLVFGCALNLYNQGSNVDLLTVNNGFSTDEVKEFEGIGGVAYYISSCTSLVGTGIHYEDHIRILKEDFIRRNLVVLFTGEIQKLTNKSNDIIEVQANVESRMTDLFNLKTDNFRHVYDVIVKRIDQYELASQGTGLIGVPTGHTKIDKITGGWQPSDFIIIAARPSMGKTAISLLFARFPALNNQTVLYFSLEMAAERLIDRLVSLETGIDSQRLQAGRIENYEWEQVEIHTNKYKNSSLHIDDEGGLTIEDIRQRSLKHSMSEPVGLIIIDYLQMVVLSGGGQTTNDKIGHVSRNCKELAKKLKCPVIALSQLNRGVEHRAGDKRPVLSDLRDSGNIEQDADVVGFLYRPEYYGFKEDSEGNDCTNYIEIDFKKNRNGPLGSTGWYKNDDWSYINEQPESMEKIFDIRDGIEPEL